MSGWEGLLAPDEKLLWQGRPEARFDWTMLINRDTPKGLFLIVFSAAWIGLALQVTGQSDAPFSMRLLFPLIALPIFLGGLRQAFGPAVSRYRRLAGTTYSLTNQAAYIATASAGKRQLERIALNDPSLSPTLEEGNPGSVWLASRPRLSGSWSILKGESPTEKTGFELIEEARPLYRLVIDTIAQSR